MTPEKTLEVITSYKKFFEEMSIEPVEYPHDDILINLEHGLAHCYGMLSEMEEFVRAEKMGKVFRWLGFIQGVLWSSKIFSLTTMKNHNRPD